MDYRINWEASRGVFAVPDAVADNGLKLATGKALKILIYFMKNRCVPENPEDIGVSADDIEDAFSYWEQLGIVMKAGSEPVKIENAVHAAAADNDNIPNAVNSETAKTPAASAESCKAAEIIRPRKALLPAEIAERIQQSDEIAFLFKSAEASLKRVLTFDDQRTLLWFFDHLGMPADIIIMLIAYCTGIGRQNMAYIEKIALNWHEKNITTHEQAENEILFMQKAFSFEGKVQTRLKLPNKLTASQKKYIDEWALMDISIDLVELAYDKTVDATGKTAFGYMNKIICKWHENGITDVNEANSFDERTKPQYRKKDNGRSTMTAEASRPEPSFDLSRILEHAKNSTPTV